MTDRSETDRSAPAADPVQELATRILAEPYNYITCNAGKLVRTQLAHALNVWLKVDDCVVAQIADIVMVLHNASLMLDDIEDNSDLRRNLPCCHKVFGIPTTINSATYNIFVALQKAVQLRSERRAVRGCAVEVFTKYVLRLHEGQGLDIYWRDNNVLPTEQEYVEMVRRKTGGLFGMLLDMMACYSAEPVELSALCDQLSIFYQVRDDLANLVSEEYTSLKGFAEDLTEGKLSFPIIHGLAAERADGRMLLRSALQSRSSDAALKRLFIDTLRHYGSLRYTAAYLRQLHLRIVHLIEPLAPNPALVAIVDNLAALHNEVLRSA